MSNLIKISKLNKSFEGIKKINVLKNISYNFKKGKINRNSKYFKKKSG